MPSPPRPVSSSHHATPSVSLVASVEQRRCATLLADLRLEYMRLPKRQLELMHSPRVLIEEISEVRRWFMGCCRR